jgi:hypothetical protein
MKVTQAQAQEEQTNLNARVPVSLKRELAVYIAGKGETIQDAVTCALRQFLLGPPGRCPELVKPEATAISLDTLSPDEREVINWMVCMLSAQPNSKTSEAKAVIHYSLDYFRRKLMK